MKKIWFMLLLICGTCAFTACSDDENDLPLSERITGIDMPKEIVLGEKAEIKAKGFTTTAKLALESKAQGTIALEDAVFTETAVTFTVPADIIIETYSVILTQDGETFNMGELKVVDKPNPVKNLEVPEKMSLGDDIVIKGKGFNETTEFIFKNEENSFTVKPLQVTDENSTITIPVDTATGIYTVSLSQNDWKWELGQTTITEKITSLQMPARIHIGKKAQIFGEGFMSENFQLVLREVDSEKEPIVIEDAIFTETDASFTVPSNINKGEFYNVVLIYGEKEWSLGEVETMNPITKRITKITFYDEYENPWSWDLQYDANRISQITASLDGEETVYKIEYADAKITVSSEYENFTYTLAGNRVAESIMDGELSYTWNYTKENYLTSINDNDDVESVYPYNYESRNLVSANYSELKYSNPNLINYLEIGDPIACIYNFFLQTMDNHQFFSLLLGISGNHSANLPTNLGDDYANAEIVYEGGDYITSASTSNYDEYEDETYTKRIVFEYEDYYE